MAAVGSAEVHMQLQFQPAEVRGRDAGGVVGEAGQVTLRL